MFGVYFANLQTKVGSCTASFLDGGNDICQIKTLQNN